MRWSVIGIGIAGRARCKAVAGPPGCRLVGVHGGRFAKDVDAPELGSFDAAVEAAEAVAICTPNALHASMVRRVLRANRHCVVEYPLALSAADGAELFEIAAERDRVLHVEHIELLTGAARALRAGVDRGSIREVLVEFDGSGEMLPGRALARSNHARFHRLADALDELPELTNLQTKPGELRLQLETGRGVEVRCVFRRGPELSRSTRIRIEDGGGLWEQRDRELLRNGAPVSLPETGGLFAADQAVAVRRIRDGANHYVSEARILEVLTLVDRIAGAA